MWKMSDHNDCPHCAQVSHLANTFAAVAEGQPLDIVLMATCGFLQEIAKECCHDEDLIETLEDRLDEIREELQVDIVPGPECPPRIYLCVCSVRGYRLILTC